MGEKRQSSDHSIGFREICTILLAGMVFTLILSLLISAWGSPLKAPINSVLCIRDQQPFIYEMMQGVGESSELPSEWTVADLLREAVRRDRQNPHPTPERCFRCRAAKQPYLVFPASASIVFDESLPEPVPILMCPPGEHGKGVTGKTLNVTLSGNLGLLFKRRYGCSRYIGSPFGLLKEPRAF